MSLDNPFWYGVAAAIVLAVIAGVADWRRTHSRELDRPGLMPWRGIQVLCLFAALGFAIIAMRT